ncbi:trypsin delta-like [Chrysoperla carnea]|uniref:trypsin delta-like n=1 Tax=Chrysoperla carnea TaxID=189513 RepID=UPI001D083D0C|nr:trypsin delta-like [Chrysoperla carnea]
MSTFFAIFYTCFPILSHIIHFVLPNELSETARRLINGITAVDYQFPYQAGFVRVKDDMDKFYCGCTIFNISFVITAAHCFLGPNETIDVIAGNSNLGSEETQRFRVINWYNHQDYNRDKIKDNDIALVEISGKFWNQEPTKGLSTIDIIDHEIEMGTPCITSGWGKLHSSRTKAHPYLQYTTQICVDIKQCPTIRNENRVAEGVLCLKSKISTMCHGDSGGPAVYNHKLVGVLSWGRGNCENFDYGNVKDTHTDTKFQSFGYKPQRFLHRYGGFLDP